MGQAAVLLKPSVRNLTPLTPAHFQQISQYLQCFLATPFPGMLIVNKELDLILVERYLEKHNFICTKNWQSALKALTTSNQVCLRLASPLPKEAFELIAQFISGRGSIQIYNKHYLQQKMKLTCVKFKPSQSHLLLISTLADLKCIEQEYPIGEKVFFIEKIENSNPSFSPD